MARPDGSLLVQAGPPCGPRAVEPARKTIVRDRRLFAAVRVDPELGTIVWPNGADLDPDVIIDGLAPAAG